MKKVEKFECSAVLKWAEIEFTNFCWLDCIWCIRKESEEFWFINEIVLEKIIFFIKKHNFKEIVISGLWDTFLHKKLYIFLEKIFQEIPDIFIYIMTKGQSINKKDIGEISKFKKKWYNLWITFSIFSLKNEEYKTKTWWWNLENLLEIIKYSHLQNINFSFEFFIDKNNIIFFDKFKKFSKIFWKDFYYTIPHNWWWKLSENIYKNLFDDEKLKDITIKRKNWEICEAFSSNYIFFDFLWNMYKCWLKRKNKELFLGNISENYNKNLEKIFEKLDYSVCKNCSYYHYKTKLW